MLLDVLLCLLPAVPASALLLLAPVRAWACNGGRRCWRRGAAAATGLVRAGVLAAVRTGRRAGGGLAQAVSDATGALRRRSRAVAATLAVLVLLPLAAWTLRARLPEAGREAAASARAVDPRVAALLQGEQLVPPPPLPPALFTTHEVEQWRPLAAQASRQWELLDPDFRQRLLLVFRLVRERHGYEMVLVEGYRSPQRQAALAALGPSVTRAGPYESWHQRGLAADCAFLRDGRVVISERDPWAMRGYAAYGAVARELGLTWGGDWRSLRDYGHVEWRRGPGR